MRMLGLDLSGLTYEDALVGPERLGSYFPTCRFPCRVVQQCSRVRAAHACRKRPMASLPIPYAHASTRPRLHTSGEHRTCSSCG
eukprot:309033-Chlamydomonas_euryale.AAC.2